MVKKHNYINKIQWWILYKFSLVLLLIRPLEEFLVCWLYFGIIKFHIDKEKLHFIASKTSLNLTLLWNILLIPEPSTRVYLREFNLNIEYGSVSVCVFSPLCPSVKYNHKVTEQLCQNGVTSISEYHLQNESFSYDSNQCNHNLSSKFV